MVLESKGDITKLKKVISVWILLAFGTLTVTPNGYAETLPVSSASHHGIKANPVALMGSFELPEELGIIQDRFLTENPPQKFVIYIQNAHANYDSELNTKKLIDYVQDKYGLPLVLLEGGAGSLDSLFFKSFPDKETKEKILSNYLKAGDLSGGEVSSILNEDLDTHYAGIEDPLLYKQNKDAFLKAIGSQKKITDEINQIEAALNQKLTSLSTPSKTFIDLENRFKNEEINVLEYLDSLNRLKPFSDLQKYPELNKLLSLKGSENSNPKSGADAAATQLIKTFQEKILPKLAKQQQMEMNQMIQMYRLGMLSQGMLVKRIEDLSKSQNFFFHAPEALKPAANQAKMISSIKGTKLFDQLEALESDFSQSLPETDEERALLNQFHQLEVVKNFSHLEILHRNLTELEDLKSDPFWAPILNEMPEYFAFYSIAVKRDEALFENALRIMDSNKAEVALISTGGFHSEGITKKLKDKNIPFVVASPKITKLDDRSNYLKAMRGERSFMKYFQGSLWDALAKDYSAKLASSLKQDELTPSLKRWRDRIIQNSMAEGRIAESGTYTRYVDALVNALRKEYAKGSSLDFEIKPEENSFRHELEKELDSTLPNYFDQLEVIFKRRIKTIGERLDQLLKTGQFNPDSISKVLASQSTLAIESPLDEISFKLQRAEVRSNIVVDQTVIENVANAISDVVRPFGPAAPQILDAARQKTEDLEPAVRSEARAKKQFLMSEALENLGALKERIVIGSDGKETKVEEKDRYKGPDEKEYVLEVKNNNNVYEVEAIEYGKLTRNITGRLKWEFITDGSLNITIKDFEKEKKLGVLPQILRKLANTISPSVRLVVIIEDPKVLEQIHQTSGVKPEELYRVYESTSEYSDSVSKAINETVSREDSVTYQVLGEFGWDQEVDAHKNKAGKTVVQVTTSQNNWVQNLHELRNFVGGFAQVMDLLQIMQVETGPYGEKIKELAQFTKQQSEEVINLDPAVLHAYLIDVYETFSAERVQQFISFLKERGVDDETVGAVESFAEKSWFFSGIILGKANEEEYAFNVSVGMYLDHVLNMGSQYRIIKKVKYEDVTADILKLRLSEAILNLANNALQATEDLPDDERIVTVSLEDADQNFRITFGNNGNVIPEEKIADIKKGVSFTTKKLGTGIGLPRSLELIKTMRGSLEVRSKPDESGKGGWTEFEVTLPKVGVLELEEEVTERAEARSAPERRSRAEVRQTAAAFQRGIIFEADALSIPEIEALARKIEAEQPAGFDRFDQREIEELLAKDEEHLSMVYQEDGDMFAALIATPTVIPLLGKATFIEFLGVDPSRQNEGIGEQLIKALVSKLPLNQFVRLRVHEGNDRAIRFYERLGFQQVNSDLYEASVRNILSAVNSGRELAGSRSEMRSRLPKRLPDKLKTILVKGISEFSTSDLIFLLNSEFITVSKIAVPDFIKQGLADGTKEGFEIRIKGVKPKVVYHMFFWPHTQHMGRYIFMKRWHGERVISARDNKSYVLINHDGTIPHVVEKLSDRLGKISTRAEARSEAADVIFKRLTERVKNDREALFGAVSLLKVIVEHPGSYSDRSSFADIEFPIPVQTYEMFNEIFGEKTSDEVLMQEVYAKISQSPEVVAERQKHSRPQALEKIRKNQIRSEVHVGEEGVTVKQLAWGAALAMGGVILNAILVEAVGPSFNFHGSSPLQFLKNLEYFSIILITNASYATAIVSARRLSNFLKEFEKDRNVPESEKISGRAEVRQIERQQLDAGIGEMRSYIYEKLDDGQAKLLIERGSFLSLPETTLITGDEQFMRQIKLNGGSFDLYRAGNGFILKNKEGKVIAFLYFKSDSESHALVLGGFFVIPAYRKRRISRLLMDAYIKHALSEEINDFDSAIGPTLVDRALSLLDYGYEPVVKEGDYYHPIEAYAPTTVPKDGEIRVYLANPEDLAFYKRWLYTQNYNVNKYEFLDQKPEPSRKLFLFTPYRLTAARKKELIEQYRSEARMQFKIDDWKLAIPKDTPQYVVDHLGSLLNQFKQTLAVTPFHSPYFDPERFSSVLQQIEEVEINQLGVKDPADFFTVHSRGKDYEIHPYRRMTIDSALVSDRKDGLAKIAGLITEKFALGQEKVYLAIGGRQGTGKTTMADEIARNGIAGLNSDQILVFHIDDYLVPREGQLEPSVNVLKMEEEIKSEANKNKKLIIVEGALWNKAFPAHSKIIPNWFDPEDRKSIIFTFLVTEGENPQEVWQRIESRRGKRFMDPEHLFKTALPRNIYYRYFGFDFQAGMADVLVNTSSSLLIEDLNKTFSQWNNNYKSNHQHLGLQWKDSNPQNGVGSVYEFDFLKTLVQRLSPVMGESAPKLSTQKNYASKDEIRAILDFFVNSKLLSGKEAQELMRAYEELERDALEASRSHHTPLNWRLNKIEGDKFKEVSGYYDSASNVFPIVPLLIVLLYRKYFPPEESEPQKLIDEYFEIGRTRSLGFDLMRGFEMQDQEEIKLKRELGDPAEFYRTHPELMFKVYEHSVNLGLPISPEIKVAIWKNRERFSNWVRNLRRAKTEIHQSFLRICEAKKAVSPVLWEIDRIGLLAAYFPEFANIRNLPSDIHIHDFTVGQHTLFNIERIESLAKYDQLTTEDLLTLRLSLIFHDQAKRWEHTAADPDHAIRAAHDIVPIRLREMGLKGKQIEKVAWLVRNHMMLNGFIRHEHFKDLRPVILELLLKDPLLKNEEEAKSLLNMLFLISLSDRSSLNPFKQKTKDELQRENDQIEKLEQFRAELMDFLETTPDDRFRHLDHLQALATLDAIEYKARFKRENTQKLMAATNKDAVVSGYLNQVMPEASQEARQEIKKKIKAKIKYYRKQNINFSTLMDRLLAFFQAGYLDDLISHNGDFSGVLEHLPFSVKKLAPVLYRLLFLIHLEILKEEGKQEPLVLFGGRQFIYESRYEMTVGIPNDEGGIFSRLTGAALAEDYGIQGAEIRTENGVVVDRFFGFVTSEVKPAEFNERFRADLAQLFGSGTPVSVAELFRQKHKAYRAKRIGLKEENRIEFLDDRKENENGFSALNIQVADRMGFLHLISLLMLKHKLQLQEGPVLVYPNAVNVTFFIYRLKRDGSKRALTKKEKEAFVKDLSAIDLNSRYINLDPYRSEARDSFSNLMVLGLSGVAVGSMMLHIAWRNLGGNDELDRINRIRDALTRNPFGRHFIKMRRLLNIVANSDYKLSRLTSNTIEAKVARAASGTVGLYLDTIREAVYSNLMARLNAGLKIDFISNIKPTHPSYGEVQAFLRELSLSEKQNYVTEQAGKKAREMAERSQGAGQIRAEARSDSEIDSGAFYDYFDELSKALRDIGRHSYKDEKFKSPLQAVPSALTKLVKEAEDALLEEDAARIVFEKVEAIENEFIDSLQATALSSDKEKVIEILTRIKLDIKKTTLTHDERQSIVDAMDRVIIPNLNRYFSPEQPIKASDLRSRVAVDVKVIPMSGDEPRKFQLTFGYSGRSATSTLDHKPQSAHFLFDLATRIWNPEPYQEPFSYGPFISELYSSAKIPRAEVRAEVRQTADEIAIEIFKTIEQRFQTGDVRYLDRVYATLKTIAEDTTGAGYLNWEMAQMAGSQVDVSFVDFIRRYIQNRGNEAAFVKEIRSALKVRYNEMLIFDRDISSIAPDGARRKAQVTRLTERLQDLERKAAVDGLTEVLGKRFEGYRQKLEQLRSEARDQNQSASGPAELFRNLQDYERSEIVKQFQKDTEKIQPDIITTAESLRDNVFRINPDRSETRVLAVQIHAVVKDEITLKQLLQLAESTFFDKGQIKDELMKQLISEKEKGNVTSEQAKEVIENVFVQFGFDKKTIELLSPVSVETLTQALNKNTGISQVSAGLAKEIFNSIVSINRTTVVAYRLSETAFSEIPLESRGEVLGELAKTAADAVNSNKHIIINLVLPSREAARFTNTRVDKSAQVRRLQTGNTVQFLNPENLAISDAQPVITVIEKPAQIGSDYFLSSSKYADGNSIKLHEDLAARLLIAALAYVSVSQKTADFLANLDGKNLQARSEKALLEISGLLKLMLESAREQTLTSKAA